MPTADPLNIKLTGSQFEPDDAAWKHATAAQRLDYWRHLGEIALDIKRREIRRGIDIKGRKLKPVKPTSRPDGAKGPPLIPHYGESRTQYLLAVRATGSSATLYWKGHGRTSWARILGYHAYKKGKRSLPVRNVIGITAVGMRKIIRDANDWWERKRKEKPKAAPKPKPAPPPLPFPPPVSPPPPTLPPLILPPTKGARVVYLGKGQKPSPLAKTIQVYETRGKRGPAAGPPPRPKPPPPPPKPPAPPKPAKLKPPKPPKPPKPTKKPKPAPTVKPAPAPVPKPVFSPPLAPLPAITPTRPALIDRAVSRITEAGIKVVAEGNAQLGKFMTAEQLARTTAAYHSRSKAIFINEQHEYWEKPHGIMWLNRQAGFLSSDQVEHFIDHELAHAFHDRDVPQTYMRLQLTGMLNDEQKAQIKREVSAYASTNPLEFVAEVYAGIKGGVKYDRWVLDLYSYFGGPAL